MDSGSSSTVNSFDVNAFASQFEGTYQLGRDSCQTRHGEEYDSTCCDKWDVEMLGEANIALQRSSAPLRTS
jgi:hypothetical protein